MNIVLDTQILVWYINQSERLSAKLKNLIENADKLAISVMSCSEVAWLVRHNRIQLADNITYQAWINIVKTKANIQILPIDETICEMAVNLPEHHKDPIDRLIIATAMHNDYYLMSVDTKFSLYDKLTQKLIN